MIAAAVRHPVVVYTLPAVVSRAVGIVLLPLYTACLSLAQFGQFELLLTAQMFLAFALSFGWESAYIRLGAGGEVGPAPLARTLLAQRAVVWAAVAGAFAVIGPARLAGWVTGEPANGGVLALVALLWVLQDLRGFFASHFRIAHRAASFAAMHIALSLLQTAFVAWLLLGAGWKLEGIVGGTVSAYAVVVGAVALIHWRGVFGPLRRPLFDRAILARVLRFGLPLAPAALAVFLVTAGDRWMLLWLVEPRDAADQQVGVYGLAFKFVALVQLFASGFQNFFSPYVYRHYRKRNAPRRLVTLFRRYSLALATVVLAMTGLSVWIVRLVFPAYEAAIPLVPLALGSLLIYAVGDFFCVGITIAENTAIRARAGIATALLNVALNLLLIPPLGPVGAAAATTISYSLYALWLMRASATLFPVPYPYAQWLAPVLWVLAAFPLALAAPAWLPAHAAVGLGAAIAAYRLGVRRTGAA